MTARKLDVVYFVRPGDANEELRYSLRSLVNLPHRKVWIVGHTPAWVTGVESIPGNVFRDKWWNVVDNLRLAAVYVKATRFAVMNDDIFLMREPDVSPLHRGLLRDQLTRLGKRRDPWKDSLEKTYAHLASVGIDEPISYELHRPVVMERAKLLEIARLCMGWKSNPPQWRTLYGNLYKVGGTQGVDGKIKRGGHLEKSGAWRELDVLSTEDFLFRHHEVGRHIRATFSTPGPYEGATSVSLVGPRARLAHRQRMQAAERIAV